jgi:hypothetical protein
MPGDLPLNDRQARVFPAAPGLDDLLGFYVAVRRKLGLDPYGWTDDVVDVLAELDDRLVVAVTPHPRPPAERRPVSADESVARAMHRLRRAALPWAGLAPAAHHNLAIAAQPLRRALEREGWTSPLGIDINEEADRG